MYGWGWKPYVSVGDKKNKVEKLIIKLKKQGKKISPLKIEGSKIATTFWGKAWCDHLESINDNENRVSRGRSYAKNGFVVHLEIKKGKIEGLVQGSSLYKVNIDIEALDPEQWNSLVENCASEIDSVVGLLQGKLSSGVMKCITDSKYGMFPKFGDMTLDCSCPDWGGMCKHVAAVLYGVGARLDTQPELLFKLRHVDHLDLVNKAGLLRPIQKVSKTPASLNGEDLSKMFGIEIDLN